MKNWNTELTGITQDFVKHFGELGVKELNEKPNIHVWSIAQNIDHLMVINRSYFPVIESIRKGTYTTPFVAKLGFVVSFMGKTVLKAVEPERKKKTKTFPIWRPSSSTISPDIVERFAVHQGELQNLISNAEDLVEKGTVISSPANKNIVYKLETAFDIIVSHEKRHLAQALEAYQLIKENA